MIQLSLFIAVALGSFITLVSLVVGFVLGKPYLDRRLSKPAQKTLPVPTKGVTQP